VPRRVLEPGLPAADVEVGEELGDELVDADGA
jgi:hypothetical protein